MAIAATVAVARRVQSTSAPAVGPFAGLQLAILLPELYVSLLFVLFWASIWLTSLLCVSAIRRNLDASQG